MIDVKCNVKAETWSNCRDCIECDLFFGWSLIFCANGKFSVSNLCCHLFLSDDDDRDIQGDRAVDYGKRHQAIDIL